ncbi:pyridoxamine 5'-phosphate oxidase family protein [Nocardia sp. IFM 10818]
MTYWTEFEKAAPRISTIFTRRHAAAKNLCMLATLRADGSPRISPMEPLFFEEHLVLIGMPGTTKFKDLERDARFCLHTATMDTMVGDGDAKLFGVVRDLRDPALHQRFAEDFFEKSGMDFRGKPFDHYFVADITGGSSVEVIDGKYLEITIWKPGQPERVVRKEE